MKWAYRPCSCRPEDTCWDGRRGTDCVVSCRRGTCHVLSPAPCTRTHAVCGYCAWRSPSIL